MRDDMKGHWEIRKSNRRRPLAAWRAMQSLLEDGERTGEVFKIVEALKGPALTRSVERLKKMEEGKKRLAEKPDVLTILQDRDALRAMPENSLGHTYLRFVEMENLSADGLMDAAMEAPIQGARDEDEIWFGDRLRDTHDLFHVVTGYGRDGLGEIALLEMSNSQTKNLGIRFVIYMTTRRSRKEGRWEHMAPVMAEAKEIAHQARWLAAQDWEALLPKPLSEVREFLGLKEPKIYKETKARFPDEKHTQTEYEIAA